MKIVGESATGFQDGVKLCDRSSAYERLLTVLSHAWPAKQPLPISRDDVHERSGLVEEPSSGPASAGRPVWNPQAARVDCAPPAGPAY